MHSSHYVFKTYFSIIRPFSKLSLTFGVPNKNLQAFLTSYASATCPAPLTLIDLIILMTFEEEYKLLISALRSFRKLTLFLTRLRTGRWRIRG
jgi:hypothetical protein